MRLIDADALRENISHCIDDAPLYILATVDQCIDMAPTIQPPPNAPLTLEELRFMSGEPIWITGERFSPRWDLIRRTTTSGMSTYTFGFLSWDECGKTWFARRRPEEVTQ